MNTSDLDEKKSKILIIKPASSSNTNQKANLIQKIPRIIEITMNSKKICQIAQSISEEQNDLEECKWKFAEKVVNLEYAVIPYKLSNKTELFQGNLFIIPDQIQNQPTTKAIHKKMNELDEKMLTPHLLHWFIAERQFILDKIRDLFKEN
ncbi:hypothetical protein [Candidatus Lokiarchaeum ossiferum]|uniref:hypothetical protein n=1 Tax=Candidatus Lokiarchaeum ossiferum TaxID=2951803 RepID=UPI00352EDA63